MCGEILCLHHHQRQDIVVRQSQVLECRTALRIHCTYTCLVELQEWYWSVMGVRVMCSPMHDVCVCTWYRKGIVMCMKGMLR